VIESTEFRPELIGRGRAEVYLAGSDWDSAIACLVKMLDDADIRVVGDLPDLHADETRVRRIMTSSSGLICRLPASRTAISGQMNLAGELGIPVLLLLSDSNAPHMETLERIRAAGVRLYGPVRPENSLDGFDGFLAEVLAPRHRLRPYAFYIGRLERDFTHAREAIRTAIENEAGIPFLWVDDGRHRTDVESIRERTRLLLQHASFVVADLTLGVESPDRENPSRAHEIGLSMAYGRRLLLLSQEPRRYTYFSINDLQTIFWSSEDDLYCRVRDWAHAFRDSVGRTTWNYRLVEAGYQPNIAPLAFHYQPNQRYMGPKTPGARRSWKCAGGMTVGATAFLVLVLLTLALTMTRMAH